MIRCMICYTCNFVFISGHKEVVHLLLKAGADTTIKMGDLSPHDIARDFDHPEILELFQS